METHCWVCLHGYFQRGLSKEGRLTLNVGSPTPRLVSKNDKKEKVSLAPEL